MVAARPVRRLPQRFRRWTMGAWSRILAEETGGFDSCLRDENNTGPLVVFRK